MSSSPAWPAFPSLALETTSSSSTQASLARNAAQGPRKDDQFIFHTLTGWHGRRHSVGAVGAQQRRMQLKGHAGHPVRTLGGPCSPFTVFQAHAVAALYLFAGRRSAVAGRRTGHGASQPDAKAPLDDRGARRPRLLPLIRGGSVLKEVERSSCWLG